MECLGSTDLRIREPDGALTDLMQADETVVLHPGGANLPEGSQLIVGEDAYPDVVLEVDNTTDVRRGKLVAYAEWGFPEVWVEVPKMASPSRPAGLSPGLTIHLLEEGRYRESSESRAFPGWGAEEIHRALNEPVMSEDTKKDLRRVGRALGEREGTVPEDELLLTRMERRARAAELAEVIRTILRRRGLVVSDGFPAKPESLLQPSRETVLDAAFTADDERISCCDWGPPPARTARRRKGPPTSGRHRGPRGPRKRATRTSSWRFAAMQAPGRTVHVHPCRERGRGEGAPEELISAWASASIDSLLQ